MLRSARHTAHLAARYAVGLARLRRSDVVLASFPRSGSTYLRRMLAEALREEPHPRAPLTFDEVNARMPEWGAPGTWPAGPPRFVKTHRPYTRLLGRQRAVLLVRDPLDALASYHRMWNARAGATDVVRSAFLRHRRLGLPRWISHWHSWQRHAVYTCSYVSLRSDPERAVSQVLAYAGISTPPTPVSRAVALASSERVRAVERATGTAAKMPMQNDFVFARDTPSGDGRRYFAEADVLWAKQSLESAGVSVALH